MSLHLSLITASSTAATARAAFAHDEPLDERGRQWVAEGPPRIRRHDLAVCGPTAACRQTADGLGLDAAAVDARLRDVDHGRWRGRTAQDVAAAEPEAFTAWLSDPHAAPHGGESLTALISRVGAWMAGLPQQGRMIAVVPVAVARAVTTVVADAPPDAFWRFEPGPLTVTVLRGTPDRWSLRMLGTPLADLRAAEDQDPDERNT